MSTMTFFGPPPRAGLTTDQHDEWLRLEVFRAILGVNPSKFAWSTVFDAYEIITGRPWQRTPQDAPRA
jgi:hypothetical protein